MDLRDRLEELPIGVSQDSKIKLASAAERNSLEPPVEAYLAKPLRPPVVIFEKHPRNLVTAARPFAEYELPETGGVT